MKKLLVTTCAMIAGATLAYSQGTIILATGNVAFTNNGVASGPVKGANSAYYFEVLDMNQSAWTALSTANQAAVYNLLANPSALALWTDTGVSGRNSSLAAGTIAGPSTSGSSAINWPTPGTSANYGGGGQTPDYYTILGWSANEGTWATLQNELNASQSWNVMGDGSWFGQTPVAFNYAGGGSGLPTPAAAVSVWAGSAATQLPGSGGVSGVILLPIPEPSTMVLAGLGGLSLLLFRRRH
ncbi:MAG: PEP-CTERM sorting domain-containing protein [Verrucomicrobiota bacterium]